MNAVKHSSRRKTKSGLVADPRRVRVTGRLDQIEASPHVLTIHIGTDAIVTAIWTGSEAPQQFNSMLNKNVVCEGLGVFRPSGTLLRIDADALAPAIERDDFFRYMPVVETNTDLARAVRLRPGEPSVYSSFFGSIPPEETDEEFAAAIDAVS